MPWTFYNASGQQLNTRSSSITHLDIDGATDIGAAIVDADLFIIDDGAGGTNRKTAASRIKTYAGVTQAVQSDIEAETNEDTYIPPDLMKHHPGIAKVWCLHDGNVSIAKLASYNVASIAHDSNGVYAITIATDLADTNYAGLGTVTEGTSAVARHSVITDRAAGSYKQRNFSNDNAVSNSQGASAIFGDFA